MRQLVVRLLVAAALVAAAAALRDIMRDVTIGFGEALQHCREEEPGLTDEMMEEFKLFWSNDFSLVHRELGCAIQCMSRYHNMLNDDQRMHRENTEKFVKSFPNGELLAEHMINTIHVCEQQFDEHEDHCLRILKIAECFRTACRELQIDPNMEAAMAEFIMEAE